MMAQSIRVSSVPTDTLTGEGTLATAIDVYRETARERERERERERVCVMRLVVILKIEGNGSASARAARDEAGLNSTTPSKAFYNQQASRCTLRIRTGTTGVGATVMAIETNLKELSQTLELDVMAMRIALRDVASGLFDLFNCHRKLLDHCMERGKSKQQAVTNSHQRAVRSKTSSHITNQRPQPQHHHHQPQQPHHHTSENGAGVGFGLAGAAVFFLRPVDDDDDDDAEEGAFVLGVFSSKT
jgi:hypothetical protein